MPAALCNNDVRFNDKAAQSDLHVQQGIGGVTSLAEFGSIQLEFVTLSQRTGVEKYADKAVDMIRRIDENLPDMVRCQWLLQAP